MGEITKETELSGIDPSQPEKLSVGEEFVEWAEKYWGLKRKYEVVETPGMDESCPYNFVKEVFATKIDKILKERLYLY